MNDWLWSPTFSSHRPLWEQCNHGNPIEQCDSNATVNIKETELFFLRSKLCKRSKTIKSCLVFVKRVREMLFEDAPGHDETIDSLLSRPNLAFDLFLIVGETFIVMPMICSPRRQKDWGPNCSVISIVPVIMLWWLFYFNCCCCCHFVCQWCFFGYQVSNMSNVWHLEPAPLPRVLTQLLMVLEPLYVVLTQHLASGCCWPIQHRTVLGQHPKVLEPPSVVLSQHLIPKCRLMLLLEWCWTVRKVTGKMLILHKV